MIRDLKKVRISSLLKKAVLVDDARNISLVKIKRRGPIADGFEKIREIGCDRIVGSPWRS
jgi:hypothetical protein